MEYTVQTLARLAGVSARTLRYYDSIGLLRPCRYTSAGYRIYGRHEVDMLQQILFFRELGLELETISEILHDPGFDRLATLKAHLHALELKRVRVDALIASVTKTIEQEEGSRTMTDHEKFEAFKQHMVDENEREYGEEVRMKYGDATVNDSNAKLMGMDKAQYDAMQEKASRIQQRLAESVQAGASPQGEEGRAVAQLHKEWLTFTWPSYSAEAHRGLAQMYVDDPRFTAYYDVNMSGCAVFLRDAIHAWADKLA